MHTTPEWYIHARVLRTGAVRRYRLGPRAHVLACMSSRSSQLNNRFETSGGPGRFLQEWHQIQVAAVASGRVLGHLFKALR